MSFATTKETEKERGPSQPMGDHKVLATRFGVMGRGRHGLCGLPVRARELRCASEKKKKCGWAKKGTTNNGTGFELARPVQDVGT